MRLCPSYVHHSPRGRTTSTATCQCLLRDRRLPFLMIHNSTGQMEIYLEVIFLSTVAISGFPQHGDVH